MAFTDLEPEQRRLVIVGYLSERPPEPGPKLAAETLAAIRRAQLALVTFELPAEERDRELAAWRDHLDTLEAAIEDEARYRLACFVAFLDPFRPPAAEEEEP